MNAEVVRYGPEGEPQGARLGWKVRPWEATKGCGDGQ